jgi:probable HAF family extracellular repeat protein
VEWHQCHWFKQLTIGTGWVLNEATGINNNGWIVGTATNSLLGITSHAFLMTATVQEPDSFAMIPMGLGLMSFVARSRKNQNI